MTIMELKNNFQEVVLMLLQEVRASISNSISPIFKAKKEK